MRLCWADAKFPDATLWPNLVPSLAELACSLSSAVQKLPPPLDGAAVVFEGEAVVAEECDVVVEGPDEAEFELELQALRAMAAATTTIPAMVRCFII